MPPAARISDMHVCPLVTPGLPPVPHVGGPILVGAPTVLVCGMPQARVGDTCTCVGPPDAIAMGSPTVLICGMPAARMGDPTIHGGTVVSGAPNVLIGVPGMANVAGGPSALVTPAMVGVPAAGVGPPPVCPPPEKTWGKKSSWSEGLDDVDVMFFEHKRKRVREPDTWGEGLDVSAGLLRFDKSGHEGWFGGGIDVDALTADGSFYMGATDRGFGASLEGEAAFVRAKFSGAVGKDEYNPAVAADVTGSILSGEGKAAFLFGDNGKEKGVEVGAVVKGELAKIEGKGEFNLKSPFKRKSYKLPFFNTEISNPLYNKSISLVLKTKKSAGDGGLGASAHAKRNEHGIHQAGFESYLGAGVEAPVHAGQHKDTGRYHVGAKGVLKVLFGVELDFDLSFGDVYDSGERHDIID